MNVKLIFSLLFSGLTPGEGSRGDKEVFGVHLPHTAHEYEFGTNHCQLVVHV